MPSGTRTTYGSEAERVAQVQQHAAEQAAIKQRMEGARQLTEKLKEAPEKDGLHDPSYFMDEMAKVERAITWAFQTQLSQIKKAQALSRQAAEELAPQGLENPLGDLLGIGSGTGFLSLRDIDLLAALMDRVMNRVRQGYEINERNIRLPI